MNRRRSTCQWFASGRMVAAALVAGAVFGLGPAARAQAQSERIANTPPPSTYDAIWTRLTECYESETNPVVQQVLFTGRYQHDFVVVDADQGDLRESNVRRMRLGTRIALFRTVILHAEVDLDPQERDPVYLRMTDAYLQWNKSRRLVLTVGKQSVPFTLDGATSSKELLTIDRSNLANNLWFPQEYMPGVSVSGRAEAWIYRAGLYSAGGINREFGEFTGGYFSLAVLGYDFAKRLAVKEAALTGTYVYQHPDPNNTFTRELEHVLSVNFKLDAGGAGLRTDLSFGHGYLGQRDMRAAMVMPFVNVTRAFQAVGRYTFIDSDGANGIRLTSYESRLVAGRGDRYNEVYLGGNYYFYGHKLKAQSGLQWVDMRDRADDGGRYSGLSWTTALRVGW